MPRLDAERLGLWRDLQQVAIGAARAVDEALEATDGMTLAWFDALSALQRADGTMRVGELCDALGAVPSSLSRRIDRLVEAGWVQRRPAPTPTDGRAVEVSLTREGRAVWRDANVTYRRAVQHVFASRLTDTDVAALSRVLAKIATS